VNGRSTLANRSRRDPLCCPTCGKATSLYMWRDLTPPAQSEAYRKRIRNLIAQFQEEGYHTRGRDIDTAVAVAQLMASRQPHEDVSHLQALLSRHMERIIASQYLETA